MKKMWEVLDRKETETGSEIVYCWKVGTGKGKKFTIFALEFNCWTSVQVEGGEKIDLPDDGSIYHITQVAKLLGFSW